MGASKECPDPAACASLWRPPSLFGDDTHAVVARPKWAPRARDTHEVWSPMSVGCEPGPSKTPTPCVRKKKKRLNAATRQD